ncbi:MAG: HD domain-containing protein [Vallitalea sp.]|jgi:putative nucleotidyltransferase with HDIG domain|nr:HD domain-containing protein [Vallitalea sp.]
MNNLIELFQEFNEHLLNDIKPSKYFHEIFKQKKYLNVYPLKILVDLKKVEQNPLHHPEGNVYNHTMQVVDNAAKVKHLSNDRFVFMWSALLHDVGKITSTRVRKGRITAYDHDRQGEQIAKNFMQTFISDDILINKIAKLVRWHMQPLFVYKELPFAQVEEMINETSVSEIALLSLCDRTGRGRMTEKEEKLQANVIIKFMTHCKEKINDEQELLRIESVIDYLSNCKATFS